MVTLGVSSTVLPPSLIRTQLSKPIFSLSFSPNLVKHGKSNFKNLTSLSPSVSTEAASPLEEDNDSVDQGDMFEWFSQWYALMPVCDLDKRVPLGKKVMGLDVVVWWDKNEDSWKVFDDRCPHILAPLSEGRIDQWGRLQCVYHGWCFGGSGDCKVIPQAPRDGPPVHTFPKACAAVYPSTVQYGIVWFWPNSDPQFKDILTKKKPPYIAELDDPSFSYLMFNKDMPIGSLPLSGTKWLKKYAGDQVDWGNRFDGSLPPTPPKEQLMDRYWTHVVNCSSCNAAYKALNALVLSLQVFSVTTVAIVAATNQQMISGVARHMLVGSAVLCFA